MSNIVIEHQGGGTQEQAALHVEEKETAYPDPNMFGPMPAHGFFLRHVRGIEMEGVKIIAANPDQRPAFVLEDVDDAGFIRTQSPAYTGVPMFKLRQVERFRLRDCAHVSDTTLDEVAEKEIMPE